MRKWEKITINKTNKIIKLIKDKKFIDFCDEDAEKAGNEEGGYKSNKYYKNKNTFLGFYLKNRYAALDNYLKNNLNPKVKTLSIGSGRCINELSLLSCDFDIVCSDLGIPQCYEKSKKLFGNFNYAKLNILNETIEYKFGYIFCLSVVYNFSNFEIEKFFKNINQILKEDGILILESPSSEDNIISFLFNEFFLVFEAYFAYYLSKLFNKKIGIKIDTNFGYRRKNKEIIDSAKKFGLEFLNINEYDYFTELERSIIMRKIMYYFPFTKKIFLILGKKLPYIRMLKFRKITKL